MRRALALICLVLAACSSPHDENLLHRERSQYRNIEVREENGERCLIFVGPRRRGRESCQYVDDPERMVFDYTRVMMGALYLQPDPRRILVIGLGGGTLPMALARAAPEAHITAIEIDPAVVRMAEEYFGFTPGPNMQVETVDGRVFVNRAIQRRARYDIVMLDAYDLNYIPDHMMTREFLESVRSILAPGGVVAANTFSTSALYDNESATYAAVFHRFYNVKLDNRIILARLGGDLPEREELVANATRYSALFPSYGVDPVTLLSLMREERDWDEDARLLTDEYSPANLLNHQSR